MAGEGDDGLGEEGARAWLDERRVDDFAAARLCTPIPYLSQIPSPPCPRALTPPRGPHRRYLPKWQLLLYLGDRVDVAAVADAVGQEPPAITADGVSHGRVTCPQTQSPNSHSLAANHDYRPLIRAADKA